MASTVRSVDFLPEIFQTPVNKQFLSATLDQLIQEPAYKQTQGYIGQRVGPGVNPTDSYVIEPTKSRTDYQLEPGVVMLNPTGKTNPTASNISDVITYPGILDAISTQGGYTDQADRLFESEYYSWDPFVDFDKFTNYAQYYWLPTGPDAVTVSADSVPSSQTFTVTRANGAYTFSGYAGTNPAITLARNGNYAFNIAQNTADAVDYRVQNNGTTSWNIDYEPNPTLTLVRGNTYTWNLIQTIPLAFYIKTAESYGTTNLWTEGVTNNGATTGLVTFTVPQDAPDTLYYCNDVEFNLRGQLNIINATSGSGPKFWIQTEPGINGTLSWSPNISDRTVLGVTNNGTDLGTVNFAVPDANAQNFYYSMPVITYPIGAAGFVNVITPTNLLFNDINGVAVADFFTQYPNGIDGVGNTNIGQVTLSGKTLIFTNTTTDPTGSIWQVQYVTVSGVDYIQLNAVFQVSNLTKFSIDYGTEYVNTQWYKDSSGHFQQIPLLTATATTLYYQDSEDPTIFGQINLINQDSSASINVVTDILGQTTYTSPNGVTFTNGLKIVFQGNVIPESYQGATYYVYGVGESITLVPESHFSPPVPYDSLPYGYGPYNSATQTPLEPDYVTISMASRDINPWSRTNRWFHTDVIDATAAYNNSVPSYLGIQRAKRPILEFRANTKLFNFATEDLPSVNVIDFTQTNALLNVNGQLGYSVDGYQFSQGSLVIFAADNDPNVRNQIYTVNFITPDTVPPLIAQPIIDLVPTSYSPALPNQGVTCINGLTESGQSYYYNGTNWLTAQQKTKVNQAPLFDVYDSNGYSFGDTTQYPSSNFVGCKLLSYAENPDNPVDTVLGIPLSFFSIDNIGDILFDNNLYTDTFVYTPSGTGITVNVSSGFVRQYSDRLTYTTEIGWQTAAIPSLPRQQFQFSYAGLPFQLDVLAETSLNVPPVQVFVNDVYILPSQYTLSVSSNTNTTTVTLNNTYTTNDIVEILVYSNQVSSVGFYEVPINLENNPFNGNSPQFTLGTVRQHYSTICQNLVDFSGTINGANNTRDLGNIVPYGQQILQQSSPLTLAGYFLRDANYDVFAAIDYNSREYIKYKNKLLNAVTQLNIQPGQSVSSILDAAIQNITQTLTSNSPFYWSDMLPCGKNYTSNTTVVNPITRPTFNTIQTYNFTSSNYEGLLVYLNGVLLLRGSQYTVSVDAPKLTILVPLSVGDVVTINEYTTTVPNWCPNTPSKMGLYPKYTPSIYVDDTYSEPTVVIQGHDGSITIAFGDIRDQVLLEFEKRVYNNIKVDDNPIPLTSDEVDPTFYPAQTTALLPGFFRDTSYTYQEINSILSESFMTWVGQNKLDYTQQDYVANNPYTYNYSQSANRLTQQQFLQGNWRGIYRYFYDTETPNTTPWEMVGFSEEPAWWGQRYGPAPYTSGNTVLWDDLEAGVVGDPAGPYILPEYARPGLSHVIPAGLEGELLPPTQCVVGLNDPQSFQMSWTAGDGGPVQASWWNSSSYPFAIMRMLALTKPAQFFSLFADRDLYRYNTTLGQYLYNGRYRLDASGVQIYGNGVSKASYINWIVDYNQQLGVNSSTELALELANLDVRLCYRMAAFSDPVYVQLFTERAGPSSTNNSLLIPPTSYDLLFYKNQPFSTVTYSAVIVQVEQLDTGGIGYTVLGYSNTQPYFEILVSSPVGLYTTITSGGVSVQVPSQHTSNIAQIPYGYTFTNATSVCDFLLSYGAYLESQGLTFDNTFNNYTLNWNQMCQEFLYFSTQGWTPGTIINLNPCATKITASQPISIVDTIASLTPENMLLDQNRKAIDVKTLVVNRDGNQFSVVSTTGQFIDYLTLKFTNYEDMIVLDNTSQYNDLIYDPVTAARQVRLSLIASTTTEWDGQLNAQGFILNLNNVKQWQAYTKYTKGEMVLYKNTYWQAIDIVEPQATFNYINWVKTDYQAIDTGLLPNLANKADQLVTTYNVYEANLTSDNDLFAFGLIGFRPRQYMTDMNLNGVTQVQIYQQFLGTKGSLNAAEIFSNAYLGKESGAYNIYENWGVLSGTYGAQANKSYFEIRLNEALLQYNPSTIQIVNSGEASSANQQVYLSDLWKESYNITSTNILPTTYENSSLPEALPSAGYVCLDDVDVTVFSIEDPSSIAADIGNIGIGTYIWIAKINSYDWGVYHVAEVPGQLLSVTNNLNGTSVAGFNAAHGLAVGDLIIVKYFNAAVNGVYRVLTVPTPTTITIQFTSTNKNVTTITGSGLAFKLDSARVSQASDISKLAYVNSLIPGAKVWVDNDGSGHWKTLEKKAPFTNLGLIGSNIPATEVYGASVAQTANTLGAIVGAPGINSIYTYFQNSQASYEYNKTITLTTTGISNFGNVVSIGKNNWAVVGANTSLGGVGYAAIVYRSSSDGTYAITQLLLPPDQNFNPNNFGTAAVISEDERWMYISAPAANLVYAYERVDVVPQSIIYTADDNTTVFNYSNAIQINPAYPAQLTVFVGTYQAIAGVDYNIDSTSVIFDVAPVAGQQVIISRVEVKQLDDETYTNIKQSSTSGYGFNALFTVRNVRGQYTVKLIGGGLDYVVGDTITIDGSVLGGVTGVNNLVVVVTYTVSGVVTGFTYTGHGIYNTTAFNLNNWLYNATAITNFTVSVNGQIQRPYLDYTFDPTTTTMTFVSGSVPGNGATIIVSTPSYWQYVTTITSPQSASGDMFGASLTTTADGRQLIVGAPMATRNTVVQAGAAYVFDRSVIRYIVSDISQMTYPIQGNITAPVAVNVNGNFLLTTSQSATGQYTISGNNVIFSNITFNYGDIIEIETNQIQQIQSINPHEPHYEAQYGSAVDVSTLNGSVYIGAPYDSNAAPQAGLVEYQVNQSRSYGITTSTIANPTLDVSGTIRINDTIVTVPTNATVAGLATAINNAVIPNVIAATTPDLTFYGDGTTKVFYIGDLYSGATLYTPVVYNGDILQIYNSDYSYDPATKSIYFVIAPPAQTVITVVSGRLIISVINASAATLGNMLTVLPGVTASVFTQLGFETYVMAQEILSPALTEYGQFGASISIDTNGVNLVVGSPNGNVYEPTTFDGGNTYFDERSTTFSNPVYNSGVAYTYDYFPSSTNNVNNPGQFAFGQQMYNDVVASADRFGTAVNYVSGSLLISAIGEQGVQTTGYVAAFANPTNSPAWATIRVQQPVVDVYSLDGVFSYNGGQAVGVNDTANGGVQTYFDFFDPLQGKILGIARQNIDYIGAVDPAQYNQGSVHNNGSVWGSEHIGQMWWDTDTVRFIDPNQDDITYASRRWGSTFPGSNVDVYQWIESTTPPASYTGSGIPLSNVSYTVGSALGQNNIFTTLYYFWVKGITSIATGSGKTLSANGVASYIADPRSSGLPYIAGLNASTIAIYNAQGLLSGTNTILSVGFDRKLNDDVVHQEYQIITDGIATSFLNTQLYRKFQDSLCGVDTAGNVVPDPTLSPGMRYGVQFRPRQSMFADRFTALENYFDRANTILKQYPISETRSFNLLNASQPKPLANTGAWNMEVPNLEILGYQDLNAVPLGYKYLVDTDSSEQGRWTIYEVVSGPSLQLVQIQNYDTPLYWYYINWYQTGYNSSIAPVAAVQNYGQLATLSYTTAPIGSSVRVINNGAGKWEIYLRTGVDPATGWTRVGLEDGTIQIAEELWNYTVGNFGFDAQVFDSQYFDETPQTETRYIIQALNEEIYIEDLAIERNSSLILMFNYVYSEFTDPSWLIKTSYVDVNHNIRALQPYQTYLQDNQDFVLDYFQEVKPYHVQVRQFNLIYNGEDDFLGDVTDYDLPAYWNTALQVPQFVSPILTPYDTAITSHYSLTSDTSANSQLWVSPSLYSQWYNNYLLSVSGATVVHSGAGYTSAPTVTVSAPENSSGTTATMTATINAVGQVVAFTVINAGSGYLTTPTITITGGGGTGATAAPVMSNSLVRSIKTTVKYDRYEYQTSLVDWMSGETYAEGTQVRYNNTVWQASATITNSVFDPAQWTLIPAEDLSGVNRTMGYYTSTLTTPGLSLPLLIDGIDYPGVQVAGLNFNDSPGFSRGPFDMTPFDNISIDANGGYTYDLALLNTIFESSYLDEYLGTRPTDINIDGGAYVDEYESHAPEELVPGIVYDTLDMRVYTTPGGDWTGQGHGFPQQLYRITYNLSEPTISFAEQLPCPYAIGVTDETQGYDLVLNIDYTIDWPAQTITIIAPTSVVANGDNLGIYVYGLGGGNQLYENTYNRTINATTIIPVEYNLIQELVIFVNGIQTTAFTYTDNGSVTYGTTLVTFNSSQLNNFVVLTAIGPTTIDRVTVDYSWSTPLTQVITSTGAASYSLTNNLEYINPVNAIVTVNGLRIQTAAGAVYVANGHSSSFECPQRIGSAQSSIQHSDVIVYFDDVVIDPSTYVIGLSAGFDSEPVASGSSDQLGYDNFPWSIDPGAMYVIFPNTTPVAGTRVYIAVTTGAHAIIDSTADTITFTSAPAAGSIISVTTFNDTREQRLLTQVFVGPATQGITVTQGFDTTEFDQANVINESGSYDYSAPPGEFSGNITLNSDIITNVLGANELIVGELLSGPGIPPLTSILHINLIDNTVTMSALATGTYIDATITAGLIITTNDLDLGRVITNIDRLWVTLNGKVLNPNSDYTVSGTYLILSTGILQSTDVVMVTQTTDSVVPEAMEFRIFQDMRGVQATYRMTPATTTALAQNVSLTDNIIYVVDASALPTPNFAENIWGVITINGERIMYRDIDTVANTVSSLLRGTAGTAAATHSTDAIVYSLDRANLMPAQFQNYIVSDSTLADGTQVTFAAENITGSSDILSEAVQVYVGGTLQTSGYTIDSYTPVFITFTTAPAMGSEVTILVRRGVTWYAPGVDTPSNGVPLQETNTPAARFLQGK